MNIVLLTCGQGDELAVHQIHHQIGTERTPVSRTVNLLILDSRRMESACFQAACAQVRVIRRDLGLNYGVIVCQAPTLPLVVAAIRCGLRDIIYQYVSAARLRSVLQSANPGVRLKVKEFDAIAAFFRTFSGVSVSDSPGSDLARREHELARRAEQISQAEKQLVADRESIENRERELRERTRRLDRQLARMQNDSDVSVTASPFPAPSSPPFAEIQAMSRQLEKRAAELDVREKLLREMESLLLATQQPGRAP